jgi:hypothetical protein
MYTGIGQVMRAHAAAGRSVRIDLVTGVDPAAFEPPCRPRAAGRD